VCGSPPGQGGRRETARASSGSRSFSAHEATQQAEAFFNIVSWSCIFLRCHFLRSHRAADPP